MSRFRLLGLTLLAVLAVAAALSPAAFALPELLPIGAPSNFTGANDGTTFKFETAKKEAVECTKVPSEGTEANDTAGVFHMTMEGCKSTVLGVACNSLGDPAKTILGLGSFNHVFDSLSPLGEAILFTFQKIHIECTALVLLILTGTVVCLWLEGLVSMATHLFHCNESAVKQEDAGYYNDSGTLVSTSLTTSENGGAEETTAWLALYAMTFPMSPAFMND